MAKKKITDTSTEEKIKAAARKLFTQKGYDGTRTRDIAEEAGINLALLNYYFRSKEKLFEIVMLEKMHALFGAVTPVVNDPSTSLNEKIEKMVYAYFDMLCQHPDLPLFVLNEIKNNMSRVEMEFHPGKLISESLLVKQLKERRPDINPMHFVLNILGLSLFPFIARPIFLTAIKDPKHFMVMMEERKRLVPGWVNAMLDAN